MHKIEASPIIYQVLTTERYTIMIHCNPSLVHFLLVVVVMFFGLEEIKSRYVA